MVFGLNGPEFPKLYSEDAISSGCSFKSRGRLALECLDIFKTCRHRMLDLVLGTEKRMRIRIGQGTLAAAVLMLNCIAVMYGLALYGVADMGQVAAWSGFCLAGLWLFYGLIRSGISLRWRDPSLAYMQMLYAVACNAAAFVIAGHGRGVCLPMLAVILMFGIFGMSMRQVVAVAGYALGLYGLVMVYLIRHPSTDEGPVLYGAYLFMVFVVLSGTTFLHWRLGKMREHIRSQKNQLTSALEKIQLIATRDELTGTANRRSMLALMRQEMQRSERSSAPLLVALLDIDHFKRVNDSYGHQAGDRSLQIFAREVQASIRATDTLARWGGEEFLILLTDAEIAVGLACLERVRARIAAAVVTFGGVEIRFTVSIGVTEFQPGDSVEKTIDRADLALYAAKAQGRNQVVSV